MEGAPRGVTHMLFTQCAADMTKFGATRVPPQKWLPRRCRDAMKGQAWGRACWPPTISEASVGPGDTGDQGPRVRPGGPPLQPVYP